jgi:hypothetical protein
MGCGGGEGMAAKCMQALTASGLCETAASNKHFRKCLNKYAVQ